MDSGLGDELQMKKTAVNGGSIYCAILGVGRPGKRLVRACYGRVTGQGE
jgi:hypothetical protein